jgi:hypothetical protein
MFGDWWLHVFHDKPAHLRFILEVARYANRAGEVTVSVSTIAEQMRIDERHVWRYRGEAIKAGVLAEVGKRGRAKVYRLNYSNPGNGCHGNDCQDTAGTLAMADANPGNEERRTLAMVVVENGIRNGLENGSIDRTDDLSNETDEGGSDPSLRRELATALGRFKDEAEINGEIRSIVRQIGCEGISALIGWLDTADAKRARNPVGFAISKVKAGAKPPAASSSPYSGLRVVGSGRCSICEHDDYGIVSATPFVCNECRNNGAEIVRGYVNGEKRAAPRGKVPNGWMSAPPRDHRKKMSELWPEHKTYGIDYEDPYYTS